MFDDPVAALLLSPRGHVSPLRPGFVVAIPSKMKKRVCRVACALSLIRSIDQDGRSRPRSCGSPFSPTTCGALASTDGERPKAWREWPERGATTPAI
jgi:hypothetical protein